MVDECVSCEADDELLFTCSYCDEQFCATHQFPHHACKGFGRAGEAGDHTDAAEWLPASSLGDGTEAWSPETTADASGSSDHEGVERGSTDGGTEPDGGAAEAGDDRPAQPMTVTTPAPSARAESLTTDTWGGSGGVAVSGTDLPDAHGQGRHRRVPDQRRLLRRDGRHAVRTDAVRPVASTPPEPSEPTG